MNNFNEINYIKATDLSRGKAANCLKIVHDTNIDTLVLKNSEPYAAIISIEKYNYFIGALKRLNEYQNMQEFNNKEVTKWMNLQL